MLFHLCKSQSKYPIAEDITVGSRCLESIYQHVQSRAGCSLTTQCSIFPNSWVKRKSYPKCDRYSSPSGSDHLRCCIYIMSIHRIYISSTEVHCTAQWSPLVFWLDVTLHIITQLLYLWLYSWMTSSWVSIWCANTSTTKPSLPLASLLECIKLIPKLASCICYSSHCAMMKHLDSPLLAMYLHTTCV